VLAIFFLVAIVTFIAFAFLFYNTTMYSLEDNRMLFVRVYLTMLVVLALGTYSLSAKADVGDFGPKNQMMIELNSRLALTLLRENNHV
jgi:hypothetical protein